LKTISDTLDVGQDWWSRFIICNNTTLWGGLSGLSSRVRGCVGVSVESRITELLKEKTNKINKK